MKHSFQRKLTTATAMFLILFGNVAGAAETVHLTLTMNGEVIRGDSTQTSLGRENTIECTSYESEFFRPTSGEVTVHRPIKIVKRIDRATPLLAQACDRNDTGRGIFRFYRPNPAGDGTTQQFYTVTIEGARLTSQRILVPSVFNPATANTPPLEEITFTYTSVTITFEDGGITTEIRVR